VTKQKVTRGGREVKLVVFELEQRWWTANLVKIRSNTSHVHSFTTFMLKMHIVLDQDMVQFNWRTCLVFLVLIPPSHFFLTPTHAGEERWLMPCMGRAHAGGSAHTHGGGKGSRPHPCSRESFTPTQEGSAVKHPRKEGRTEWRWRGSMSFLKSDKETVTRGGGVVQENFREMTESDKGKKSDKKRQGQVAKKMRKNPLRAIAQGFEKKLLSSSPRRRNKTIISDRTYSTLRDSNFSSSSLTREKCRF